MTSWPASGQSDDDVEIKCKVALLAQLFEQLNGAIEDSGIGIGPAASCPSFLNSSSLVLVEAEVVVVELDPVVPGHGSQAHCDVVR